MNTPLPLSLLELLILIAGAIMLGITIHFFIVSRRSLNATSPQTQLKVSRELEERKLRYLNDLEWRDKEIMDLRKRIRDLEEENELMEIESEELREKNKKLAAAPPAPVVVENKVASATEERNRFAEKLKIAQQELQAYNERIALMLSKIDVLGAIEEEQKNMEEENEHLRLKVEELTIRLERSEKSLRTQEQKKEISTEMSSMLDNAFTEFTVLQQKIAKLEGQVSGSQKLNLDYIDAQEELLKLRRTVEEERKRYHALNTEKNMLAEEARETEEKLRESNFQRQQMQKRISYLEELNMDLQSVAEVNSNLQLQIRRISELESMLQLLSEEKEELMKKKG